jgi:uncharacterized protein YkwD
MKRLGRGFIAAGALAILPGCGELPPSPGVSKTVTVKEQPVGTRLVQVVREQEANPDAESCDTAWPLAEFNPVQYVQYFNQIRSERGIPPLQLNPMLNFTALATVRYLEDHPEHGLDHPTNTGGQAGMSLAVNTIRAAGFDASLFGENIVTGTSVNTWRTLCHMLEIEPFRANVLYPGYTQVGVAAGSGGQEITVAQFIAPLDAEQPVAG